MVNKAIQFPKQLIWLDLEMTGLDPQKNRIIEIATIVTDGELNVIAEGPSLAIFQKPSHLALMDNWNKNTHADSGLLGKVEDSLYDEQQAEIETLDFLKLYVNAGISPLCGNSVHQDRRFLYQYMPELAEFFHYRNIDVSTLKILANIWYEGASYKTKHKAKHTAKADILFSIEELRYYKENILR